MVSLWWEMSYTWGGACCVMLKPFLFVKQLPGKEKARLIAGGMTELQEPRVCENMENTKGNTQREGQNNECRYLV